MAAATTFDCPGCGVVLPAGTDRCAECGILLSGRLATELWQLDQNLTALTSQRQRMIDALRYEPPGILPTEPTEPAGSRPGPRPGAETRHALLVLGAGCLVAALAAGTAVVWHALGPAGQAALMVAVTATVLALAVRLERLPATAQALAAVGVAGLLIDCVAGRSLELAGVRAVPLHVYAGLAASAVSVVLAGLTLAARRLWAPPIGCAIAAMTATAAWVQPTSVDRAAWLGVAATVVAVLVERVLAVAGRPAVAGRCVNASLAAALAGIGAVSAVVAAVAGRPGSYAGGVLVVLLLALPEASGVATAAMQKASAAAAGLLAGELALALTHQSPSALRVGIAGGAGVLGIAVISLSLQGFLARLRLAVQLASLTVCLVTYCLVIDDSAAFAHLNLTYAALCLALAAGWRMRGDSALTVRAVAAVAAVPFATIGADLQLNLGRVTTPEAYVLVPAVGLLALGAAAMLVSRQASSWCLAPALVLGVLPTLWLALEGDSARQALALGAGAAIVVIGAQLRLAAPLAVGGGVLGLLVLRLVGPEVKHVPEWVALGAVGIVLLFLGATWEARLLDLRRAAHALRPRIAALR